MRDDEKETVQMCATPGCHYPVAQADKARFLRQKNLKKLIQGISGADPSRPSFCGVCLDSMGFDH